MDKNMAKRGFAWLALGGLLGWQSMQVEDGQFTREYSRLYTALVLGIGLLLFVGGAIFFANLVRSLNK